MFCSTKIITRFWQASALAGLFLGTSALSWSQPVTDRLSLAPLPEAFASDRLMLDPQTFAHLVLLRNPNVLLAQGQRDIAVQQLRNDEGAYETEFFASFNVRESNTRNTNPTFDDGEPTPVIRDASNGFEVGVRRLFRSGAEITVDYEARRTRNNMMTSNDPEGFKDSTGALNFTIRQPLSRGFRAAQVEGRIAQSEQQMAMTQQQIRQQMLNKTAEAQTLYWQLYREEQLLQLNRQSLDNAAEVVADTKRMVGLGLLPRTALAEAQSVLLVRESQRFAAEQAYTRVIHDIKTLLNIQASEQALEFATDSAPQALPWQLELEFNEYLRTVLRNWPNYEVVSRQILVEQEGLRMANDELKPQVDLVLGYGQTGRRYETTHLKQPFLDSLTNNHPNWRVALELSMPIGGNQSARARQQIALTRIQQSHIDLQALEVGIANELSVRLKQVEQTFSELDLQFQNVEIQRELLRVERQRFEQGMTRLMDLVEREENFNTAIIRWVDAQIQYETAKVSLQLADGSLLDTFNIQFDLEI